MPEIPVGKPRKFSIRAEAPACPPHLEPFGSGIDRGGQPGGAGADDDHVVDPVGIERLDQPEAAGERGIGRPPQQVAARAQHDRQLVLVDVEAFEQRPRGTVLVGVEADVGMAVAAQEILQPVQRGIAAVADQHRPAALAFEQADAAQDQRAHDPLAEVGLGDQQRAQPLGRDHQDFAVGGRGRVDQRGAA
jgi:hypothetical protein